MSDLAQEDYEWMRLLLADIRSLIRAKGMSAEAKLQVIDRALTEAIAQPPEAACEYVRRVTLDLFGSSS